MKLDKQQIIYLSIIIAAVFLRLGVTLTALSGSWEKLSRPDTVTYLEPARSVAAGKSYSSTRRPPGFPMLAAGVYALGGSEKTIALLLALLGGAAAAAVIRAGVLCGGSRAGAVAGGLYALNITAIGNAGLLLSDTLGAVFAALQFMFFAEYWKKRKLWGIFAAAACAGAGVLIRPVNMLWILPLIFLVCIDREIKWRKKIVYSLGAAALFLAIIFPWMLRNKLCGAGFCVDTNTGAMYHQNGAMILGEVSGRGYEAEKRRILAEQEELFKDTRRFPDEASREAWRIARYREVVRENFPVFLKQQINWQILLPDAPSLLECLNVTSPDRGTMAVLKEQGLFAAVKHYFGSNWFVLLLLLLPLLAIYGATLLGCGWKFAGDLLHFKERSYDVFVFLAFVEYYLFLPGAITAPRYQLPALPCACVFAAIVIVKWVFRKKC